ncbi:MAG TPA: Rne/Rng family ribonuclease [Bacilli bacterium]|nr:Rne/Rng family ribonuclease [Bacilli bacterium]
MKQIIFNLATRERRAAIIEDDQVAEIYIERSLEHRIVGNVYIGKVMNVLPGMQAAFVDIGRDKNGFLYRDDLVAYQLARQAENFKEDECITKLLTEGQEIVVQVTKESFGTKGPRLTEVISFPGKYIVYLPDGGYVALSRRLREDDERQRLKALCESLLEGNEGVIVRTSSEGVQANLIAQEIQLFREFWKDIIAKRTDKKRPMMLHQDTDLLGRLVRDLSFGQVSRIVVDDAEEFVYLRNLLKHDPKSVKKIELYKEKENIFSAFGIEKELEKALRQQVWLKNGGYLIIDQTEALTVIDVNTGKYIGKQGLQETVFKTNLEAAKEIARQLRLRDISGIIIIDFIDMKEKTHQKEVLDTFEHALERDRTKTNVIGITSLGLVEMTRKKIRQNLNDSLTKRCPTCAGKGTVLSDEAQAYKIERMLWEYRLMDHEAMIIELPKHVARVLRGEDNVHLKRLEEVLMFRIFLVEYEEEREQPYTISFIGSLKEAEERYVSLLKGKH